jgi:hypothetical protein
VAVAAAGRGSSSRELPVSEQHDDTPAPEWWSTSGPADTDRHGELADAAASMRDAAEYMRDAATPSKESNWDWSWFLNWLKSPTGKTFKIATISSGPGFGVLLWYYAQTGNGNAGAAAFFFTLLTALAYLVWRRAFFRWLMWGAMLSPLYYWPALKSLVLGIGLLISRGI